MAWLSDHTRPFALVLVQADDVSDTPLGKFGHLGIACASREEIDRKTAMAVAEGVLRKAPEEAGEPVGYYVFLPIPMAIRWSCLSGSASGLKRYAPLPVYF